MNISTMLLQDKMLVPRTKAKMKGKTYPKLTFHSAAVHGLDCSARSSVSVEVTFARGIMAIRFRGKAM